MPALLIDPAPALLFTNLYNGPHHLALKNFYFQSNNNLFNLEIPT